MDGASLPPVLEMFGKAFIFSDGEVSRCGAVVVVVASRLFFFGGTKLGDHSVSGGRFADGEFMMQSRYSSLSSETKRWM